MHVDGDHGDEATRPTSVIVTRRTLLGGALTAVWAVAAGAGCGGGSDDRYRGEFGDLQGGVDLLVAWPQQGALAEAASVRVVVTRQDTGALLVERVARRRDAVPPRPEWSAGPDLPRNVRAVRIEQRPLPWNLQYQIAATAHPDEDGAGAPLASTRAVSRFVYPSGSARLIIVVGGPPDPLFLSSETALLWPEGPPQTVTATAGKVGNNQEAAPERVTLLRPADLHWTVENPAVAELAGGGGDSILLRPGAPGGTTLLATVEGSGRVVRLPVANIKAPPPDLWFLATTQTSIGLLDARGAVVRTQALPPAPGRARTSPAPPSTKAVALTVDASGRVRVLRRDGQDQTATHGISTYDPVASVWSADRDLTFSRTVVGRLIDDAGLAALGDYLFFVAAGPTDIPSVFRVDSRAPNGAAMTPEAFATGRFYHRVVAGRDGLLYVVSSDPLSTGGSGQEVNVYDPRTLARVGSVVLPVGAVGASLGVSSDGHLFVAVTGGPSGTVLRRLDREGRSVAEVSARPSGFYGGRLLLSRAGVLACPGSLPSLVGGAPAVLYSDDTITATAIVRSATRAMDIAFAEPGPS